MRKQIIKSGDEDDVVYRRKWYCYLVNNHSKIVKRIKRKLNKRYRRELKKETINELLLVNEESLKKEWLLPVEIEAWKGL